MAFTIFPFKLLALFYLVNIPLVLIRAHIFLKKRDALRLHLADLQEKINLCYNQIAQEEKLGVSLRDKIRRYDSLKRIIEEINKSLDLDMVTQDLVDITFTQISRSQGACILYLVDPANQSLALFKARKQDNDLVIKAKDGDIFDKWVLRHSSPLLVGDIRRDFRFDIQKPSLQERLFSSLVSSAFISQNRLLGILRLDNPQPDFYTQDDLRFLVTVCEIGAVALENSQLYQRTKELAMRDALTGLFNKGYFFERLKDELKRAIRRDSELSLLMLDVDYFKNYNDSFGHAAGDIVLKELCAHMGDALKDFSPILSRFGGEEFSVILSGIKKEEACLAAQALCKRIENAKVSLRRQETGVTVSIGVAAFPRDASDADELVFKADRALYEAKKQGRNRAIAA